MRQFRTASIIDVEECGVSKNEREILLDAFESIMKSTSNLVKKAEFDLDEFASTGQKVKGYSLTLERLMREIRLDQWQATFIKDGKVVMIAIGQLG